MTARRIPGVERGAAITLTIDGAAVPCFAGESVATAMLAHGGTAFRHTGAGAARGMFCNMGTCGECTVLLAASGRRARACLIEATDGLEIATLG